MRLIASLMILMPLLAGCATGPAATLRTAECPSLAAPPQSIVDALEDAARADTSAAAWVIALDRHYRMLDAC